jgi:antitoxin component YwqK of YwqJK toxin-antitoxin module
MTECADIYIPGYEQVMKDFENGQSAAKTTQDNRVVEERWANGKVQSRYKLVNGKNEGKEEKFFQNGTPSRTTEYAHGKKNGVEMEYFEGGQLQRQATYSDNFLTSEVIYYQNGKKSTEWITIKQAFPVSTHAVKSYYDNGHLHEQGTQVGEHWDGNYQSFDENGSPRTTGKYDRGHQVGTWHSFSKQGQDEFDEEEKYEQGTLVKRNTYKNKKLIRSQEFMPDGSAKSDRSFPETGKPSSPSL